MQPDQEPLPCEFPLLSNLLPLGHTEGGEVAQMLTVVSMRLNVLNVNAESRLAKQRIQTCWSLKTASFKHVLKYLSTPKLVL